MSIQKVIAGSVSIGILKHDMVAHAETRLIETARDRGHTAEIISPFDEVLTTENGLCRYDVIISRAEVNEFASSETDAYLRVLNYYESTGVPVINSAAALINAQDKYRTHRLAENEGVLTPRTYLVYGTGQVHGVLNNGLSYPVIIKKPYGGRGEGVFSARDSGELENIIERNFEERDPIIVQEYIYLEKNAKGNVRDMRILVCRDAYGQARFIDGFYRNAQDGDFRSNLCRGGNITLLESYDSEVAYISEKALDAIGADIAGVDIARSEDGNLYLIEINITPDLSAEMETVLRTNVFEMIIDLAEARTVKSSSSFLF